MKEYAYAFKNSLTYVFKIYVCYNYLELTFLTFFYLNNNEFKN